MLGRIHHAFLVVIGKAVAIRLDQLPEPAIAMVQSGRLRSFDVSITKYGTSVGLVFTSGVEK